MKRLMLFVILGLFIAGCSIYSDYEFREAVDALEAIDSEHETSMYKEQLDRVMLNFDDVEEMIRDLEALEDRLEYEGSGEDAEAARALIDFRKKMLRAEEIMIKVRHIGAKGDIRNGFMCKNKDYIYNTSVLIKDAVYKGGEALESLDKLTGFAVASEYIGRDDIIFDESAIERLLSRANRGIEISKEGGFCDKEDEITGD